PLGAFRRRVGQLSGERIGDYRAEIDRVVPLEVRRGRFEELDLEQEWDAKVIRCDDGSGRMVVGVESVREVYQKVGKSSLRSEAIDPWITHHNLAEKFQAKGKLNETIEAYGRAIDVNPSYFKSYHGLGEALQAQGKLTKAMDAYSRALELKPDFSLSRKKLELVRSQKNPRKNSLYILDTHQGDPSGLGVVASRFSALGQLITDTTQVKGKVFIPGRADYYSNLVKNDNINYILTMFESSQIPSSWVEAINNNFTEVFVPHNYVRKAFQDSGVVCPISILPLAYSKRKRVEPMSKEPGKLKLGYLCGPAKRKNVEQLIQGVEELFQEGKKIELFIHCNWLKPEQKQWSKLPFVNLTEGKLSDDFINQWYSQLDAYICPSSGEGWSLTPRESMSLGIPTIISDIEVHQELLESGFYLPIISNDWQPAYYEFLKGNCGEWKAYSVQQIKSAIIQMINDYDYWYSLAETGKNWVASKYKWESVERQLLAEIYPKHLLFSLSGNEVIDNYCQSLVSSMSKTKYVQCYHQLEEILQRESIQSIHVQYDSNLFNNQELFSYVNQWQCVKKITIHRSVDDKNIEFKQLLSLFDEIYVFTVAKMIKLTDQKILKADVDLKYYHRQLPKLMEIYGPFSRVFSSTSNSKNTILENSQQLNSKASLKSNNSIANMFLSQGMVNAASFHYHQSSKIYNK
ncbi:MAG: tetratricopeptide repeat protein, partial [Trichodesmium sp. MAG_R04]|nr:tetratricopeptide repeat protein [Trichodesmium sp. MAG_R04]